MLKEKYCTNEKQKENRWWTIYYGNFKGVEFVLCAIGDQLEPLKNAFDDDPSDPEICSDTSEKRF